MENSTKSLGLIAVLVGLCGACTNPAGMCTVEPGDAWDAPDWEANTAEAIALRNQLATLVGTMRDAETMEATVDGLDDLTGPYTAGDPSLQSVTSPFFDGVTQDAFAEFVEVSAAGTVDLVDDSGMWTPQDAGGIYGMGSRGINEGGLEVRQIVDKGLFSGGAFYNHALTLTEGDITPATIEAIAALWGANATLDPAELDDSANYSHSMGYFADMKTSLIAAHAYAADEGCVAERDEAIVAFFRGWEQSMYARFIHYANVGASEVGAAAGDDDWAHALHELAEGVGLSAGFYGLEDPASGPLSGSARVVSNAQLDEMMGALGVDLGDLGASTTGAYVSDPEGFAAAVLQVEDFVANAFQLDASVVEGWRIPTEG